MNTLYRKARPCIRCTYKQYAPREFSSVLGSGDRVIHKSHHLAGARGVIWCWRCGAYGTFKPRRLINECRGYPTQNGADNLSRLRKGLPPNHLKGSWPNPDTAVLWEDVRCVRICSIILRGRQNLSKSDSRNHMAIIYRSTCTCGDLYSFNLWMKSHTI